MNPNRRVRRVKSWLMASLLLIAASLTAGCATYYSDSYDSASGTYYRADRCRTVNRVVTENGVVVRDSSRLVCAAPGRHSYYYYGPYNDRD